MHGADQLDLATVLGPEHVAERAALVHDALDLFERKGHVVLAGRARALLAGEGSGPLVP